MSKERIAGRELDAEVAERVMGWRNGGLRYDLWSSHSEAHVAQGLVWLDADGRVKALIEDGEAGSGFRPSTDIAAAFQVVEAMRAKGCHVFVSTSDPANGGVWVASFVVDGLGGFLAHADTPALAICLASLDATKAAASRNAQLENYVAAPLPDTPRE